MYLTWLLPVKLLGVYLTCVTIYTIFPMRFLLDLVKVLSECSLAILLWAVNNTFPAQDPFADM